MHGLIIKDDPRYDYTKSYLEQKGFIIYKDFDKNLIDKIDFILFPFKKEIDKNIYDKNFFSSLKKLEKNILIFTGVENKYIKKNAQEFNLNYEPLMNLDYIAILNAIPTAEGVIAYLIQNRKKTIMGAKILVIGYGRCGSVLAEKLFYLGAKVFVHTRSQSSYSRAISNRIQPFYDLNNLYNFYGDKNKNKKDFDVIINTAPVKIITDKELLNINNKTLIIDITRDGLDIDLARSKNKFSTRLLGIPAKFAVQTAGEILGKYIYEKVTLKNAT